MVRSTILLEIQDGVATLTLNRPDRLNAINLAMHEELAAALDEIAADRAVRALLLTGAGPGFCAGQDLAERASVRDGTPIDLGDSLEQRYNPLIRRLVGLNIPVVAAVNGVAAGAGVNLALACDIVLAGRAARFTQSFCKIGLVPDCGGTFTLPRLVGAARARALMLLGETLNGAQAEVWGMIWRCYDDTILMREARAMATNFARQPTTGLGLIKQALRASADSTFDEQLDRERDLQRIAGHTQDYREGVTAFLDKRPPQFSGE